MKHQEQILKLNKSKTTVCYSLTDFYDEYAKDRGDLRTLSAKKYKSSLKKVFALIAKHMIEERRPYHPRVGLGRFGIVKRKASRRKIDWNLTKKHQKIIYFTNTHSEGCYFRWHWEKGRKCYLKHKNLYSFTVVRSLKQALKNHILTLDADPTQLSYDTLRELPPYEN